mgnify:CR=1 FL=1
MKSSRMTTYILGAMVLGIAVGAVIHAQIPDPATQKVFAGYVSYGSTIFLRLIKMIIAPLVFATLVGGIAHMGSGSKLGRVFAKTLGWFVCASFISLLLGLVMVNLLRFREVAQYKDGPAAWSGRACPGLRPLAATASVRGSGRRNCPQSS